jgi:hypothetical protein
MSAESTPVPSLACASLTDSVATRIPISTGTSLTDEKKKTSLVVTNEKSIRSNVMRGYLTAPSENLEKSTKTANRILLQYGFTFDDMRKIPKFKFAIQRYMDKNLCGENLRFLEAITSFEALESEARTPAAKLIWNEFVILGAPDQVNLNSEHVQAMRAVYTRSPKCVPPDFFEQAKNYIKFLCENDSFRRFVKTPEFEASRSGNINPRDYDFKNRRLSFSLIPNTEKTTQLATIADDFRTHIENKAIMASGAPLPAFGDSEYKSLSFSAQDFITWAVSNKLAPNATFAEGLGQRLQAGMYFSPHLSLTSSINVHTSGDVLFGLSDVLWTCLDEKNGIRISPIMVLNRSVFENDDYPCVSGELLLRDFSYHPLWVVYRPFKGELFLFRYKHSVHPFLKVEDVAGAESKMIVEGHARRHVCYLSFHVQDFRLQFRLSRGNLFPWIEAGRAAQLTVTIIERNKLYLPLSNTASKSSEHHYSCDDFSWFRSRAL